jgi:hypothetical protein
MLVGLALMAVPLLVACDAVLQIRDLADTGQKIVIGGDQRAPPRRCSDRSPRSAHGAPVRRAQ